MRECSKHYENISKGRGFEMELMEEIITGEHLLSGDKGGV